MENKLKPSLNSAIQLREAGEPEKALQQLLELHQTQPDNPLINYHCAWTHDKLGNHQNAMEILLRNLAETSQDDGLQRFKQAILFYANNLDAIWT